MQRAAQLALRALAIELVGFVERLRIDRQRRVQAIFVHRDPHQVLLDQLPRRHLALRHRRLHLRNRRFDDGESALALGGEREHRHDQHENEGGSFHAPYSKIDRLDRGNHFRYRRLRDTSSAAGLAAAPVAGARSSPASARKTLGASLAGLRDAMRANRFRAAGQQIFLERAVTSFDGRTRAEGFHILHDWDGVAQQTNPDIIPVDVLHFLAEQRGADAVERARARDPARLLLHARPRAADHAHLGRRRCRTRISSALNAMLAELQGPERQRPAVCRRRRDADADRHVALRAGRVGLRQAAREGADARRARTSSGSASAMRRAWAVTCVLASRRSAAATRWRLRDDNIADYPWLCFALAAVMREYVAPGRRAASRIAIAR